jgi:hypothetical protein
MPVSKNLPPVSSATFVLQNTKKLCRATQNKSHGMLRSSVVLLKDNVHPHTAARTWAVLEHFNWEFSDHPPYSPDLALSSYYLFTYLKNWLGSQSFNNNEVFMEGVKCGWVHRWQISLTQSYKNLFPNMTSASIPAVTMSRSSLSMHIFFLCNTFFFSDCLFC